MTLKLVALLSWFDEEPTWLQDMALSLRKLNVDQIVGLDGAYSQFPFGRTHSPQSNYEALMSAGIPVSFEAPTVKWATEMDKRTRLFQLGEEHTGPDDWYLVIDGDNVVTSCTFDLKRRLGRTKLDVGELTEVEPHPDGSSTTYKRSALFRAIRGLHVKTNHYTYACPDGRILWGRNCRAPKLDLLGLRLEHRTNLRESVRRGKAKAYYHKREDELIELGNCERCGDPAQKEIPANWKRHPKGLTSEWISVCLKCEPVIREESNRVIRSHGLDPATIQVSFEKAA